MRSTSLTSPSSTFDKSIADTMFIDILNGGDLGLYGSDVKGSVFFEVKTGEDDLTWSLNNIQSALRVMDTAPLSSVFPHVTDGLDGLLYHGCAKTIAPMHTEDGDFFSINYSILIFF